MSHLFPKGISNPTFTKGARPCSVAVSLYVVETQKTVELTLIQADGKQLSVSMSHEDARLLSYQLIPTREGA